MKNGKKYKNKEFQRRLYLYFCDKYGYHGYFVINKFADYYKKVKLGKFKNYDLTNYICPNCNKGFLVDIKGQEIFCVNKGCKYDKTIWDYAIFRCSPLESSSKSEIKELELTYKKLN